MSSEVICVLYNILFIFLDPSVVVYSCIDSNNDGLVYK